MFKLKKWGGVFDIFVAIKGAGDLATGVACRLFNSNVRNICLMEIDKPLAVRRLVSFSEAVYRGHMTVEGTTAVRAESINDMMKILRNGKIPVMVDPLWNTTRISLPDVLIDGIMAKKNTGTNIDDAQLVIGLGPGFSAGNDVDFVIETKRGHNLGKVLRFGEAQRNTSIPEKVNNFTFERVIRSPVDGFFKTKCQIGDFVRKGEVIGLTDGKSVSTKIDGILRGLVRSNMQVVKGMKIADVDPRGQLEFCHSISDKARAVGGAVLEAVFGQYNFREII